MYLRPEYADVELIVLLLLSQLRLGQSFSVTVGETAFERYAQEFEMSNDLGELIKTLIPLNHLNIEKVLMMAVAGIARKVFVAVVADGYRRSSHNILHTLA